MNMKNVDQNTEVTFTLSIGYAGATREETFTLEHLGWNGETGSDLVRFLDDAHDVWQINNVDTGWYIEGEEE
ncbi:hypothetical protein ACM9DY_11175 [Bacillus velezensis]|uniref:DUF7167 family protein n=1 Tax=Bacillus amyloliquefaciens group TaxID=1938374 RepID=UPI001FD5DDA0|nr:MULTISPECIES: hypothetical protein [Bacillus amyloliquefaciens group]MCX4184272.1 hypothetical protein [Bacillus amyloliquefaciens]MEC1395573.1 hypothetical protein [Bacillus velezensis]MEC1943143.1 hypothetical protein [Bacillus velezensis]UOO16286.1 hypothetical protein KHA74_10930 [Bacillus velezensis]WNJ13973.1 hypothetical protein RJY17_01465 [Bacillus velezensis]